MNCPDCGSGMAVKRTMKAGTVKVPLTNREEECDCGQRFLSEQRIVKRLAATGSTPVSHGSHTGVTPNGGKTDIGRTNLSEKGGGGVFPVSSSPVLSDSLHGFEASVPDPSVETLQGVDPARARRKRVRSDVPESVAFAAFYEAYPRKVARDRAWSAWQSRGLEPEAERVMVALSWQTHAIFRLAPWDKIPHPASWINDGRWKDVQPSQHVTNGVPEKFRASRSATMNWLERQEGPK